MKPYFDKKPIERKILGNWVLTLEEFRFYCSRGLYIKIPKYVLTDGPSIPTMFLSILQREDIYFSGVAHDFSRDFFQLSDRGVDGLFYDMCKAEGNSTFKSTLAYLGVRIGSYLGIRNVPDQKIIDLAKEFLSENQNLNDVSRVHYSEKYSRFKILPSSNKD